MKFWGVTTVVASLAALQSVSAHYVFSKLVTPSGTNTASIRQPLNTNPIESLTGQDIVCNKTPNPATQTLPIAAGSTLSFISDNTMGHPGPGAVYLGKAPGKAADWNGSGANWFKIAEWGATFNPFHFKLQDQTTLTFKVPAGVPNGEYLLRVEHVGLHIYQHPQWYVSCAQVQVTGGGSGNPAKVSIPGYYAANDAGLTADIYNPETSTYRVPGPNVWSG